MRFKLTLLFISIAAGFFIQTYFTPWEMLFDTSCSESPIGFYRLQVVPYELNDYGGAEVQAGDPIGGIWEFAQFYVGQFDPCSK